MAEPAARPELLPNLQLDELLAELQSRLQAVLATGTGCAACLRRSWRRLGLTGVTLGGSSRPRSAWWTRPPATRRHRRR